MAYQWGCTIRDKDGLPVIGKGGLYFKLVRQIDGYEYWMKESSGHSGYYYVDTLNTVLDTPSGAGPYKIYAVEKGIWFALEEKNGTNGFIIVTAD